MRIPSDLTADPSPRRRHRARWWLDRRRRRPHHPAGVAALAGRALHRQPLVLLGRLPQRLLDAAGHQARPLRRVRGDLLRRPVGQPRRVRPHRRATTSCSPRRTSWCGATSSTCGPTPGRIYVALAFVLALIGASGTIGQWNNWILFRHGGNFGVTDPQFHKDVGFYVFKLPVPDLHRRLDAGHPDRDARRVGRVPLLQRGDPAPAWPAARAATGQGAHLGAARPDRAGQGGRLRPAALVTRQRAGRLRQRRRLHRRARPPAGRVAARLRVDLRRGDPALQHPAPGLDAAGARRRHLGLRGPRRRHHLPGAAAGAEGDTRPRARSRRPTSSATSRPPGPPTA